MVSLGLKAPAFGQADLQNCEREQIHLAASIQPHGALLLLREPDLVIVQASANASNFLALDGPLVGRRLADLQGDLAERFEAFRGEPLHAIPAAFRCKFGSSGADFDALAHRPPGGGLILEMESAGSPVDFADDVAAALDAIVVAPSLRALAEETAKIFKAICGYDRVMVYRFDEEGHGEVFAEEREARLEAFLGNRYPASDIPQIARRLYIRNRVRILVDVAYEPIPLIPRQSPITGRDLDMSLCALRSMSPMHIQYLKNMGVGATLVISLVVGGKLWGLVSCHHYGPRFVPCGVRSVCELLAEAVATRIAALESFLQSQAELSVRRLEQRVIDAIASEGDWRGALFDGSNSILQPLGAGGAALLFDGQILTTGETPGSVDLRELGRWLDAQPVAPVIASSALGVDAPRFSLLTEVASGLLAAPISNIRGEYLLWFRPERIRTVVWGGNPYKPVVVGDDPRDLSPRRSFAQWLQLMEGSCEPWTPADLTAARLIGATIADLVLQFRSVQMLVLQDQLEQVRRHVRAADPPVAIADAEGRIVQINEAFEALASSTHRHFEWLDDLVPLFAESAEVRRRFSDLVTNRKVWRGEVQLDTPTGAGRPMLIRADPVYAARDRVRGFVVLLTDNTERKAAGEARLRFQEGLLNGHRLASRPIGGGSDLIYRNLMSTVVENAQLAVMEITDRAEVGRMAELLDSVRASVARTAQVLERLILHARPNSDS